ncbi:histidine phosphatase family protein [Kibdelosporangium philippinense]|uniref:Histidine phosphatase family protein n=1 Tax=Kibdelosporangium philippinense TaxID=211113 RepID=A0ABS8ZUZ1_9PSEU|nr:histidine phosphatase family protein [Kibdelosporangium philippinense]MCE7011422.1 histidine phosphatase family protein [Kibdelosporangium philippinense]
MSTLGDAAHPNASTRVILISHAATAATRRAAFPTDEPVERPEDLHPVDLGRFTRFVTGPELRCRQTATGLGVPGTVDEALADQDFGSWRGRALNDITDFSWLTDPSAAPHGGESVEDVIARVAKWLTSLRGTGERVAAVTHPAVIRAAVVHVMNAPAQSFWRTDVSPLSVTRLSSSGPNWTLQEHAVNQ